MLEDIELALSKGKIEGAKVLLKEYFYKELTTNKVPCNTCDTIVDDETCSECNGTGYVEGTKITYPADKEIELKVDEYLSNSNEYKKYLKKEKIENLNKLEVEHNTVFYDANGDAIGNMAAVVTVAQTLFIQAVSIGLKKENDELTVLSNIDAYNYVFKQTVSWKGADNKIHEVQIESLVETMQKAMSKKAKIIFKY